MGEIPRDIPEQENFSTSAERNEFMSAANFDPTVEAAVSHMEAYQVELDNETVTPLDAVLDEYSNTLKLLSGDLDPATRTRLEGEREALREKISVTEAFDQTVEQQLAGAVEREEKLHDRADTLVAKHPISEGKEPVDPSSPAAKMLQECIRVKLLAENLFLKTEDKAQLFTETDQLSIRDQLKVLKKDLLGATEELASSKLDTRFPEKIPMEVWERSLTKLQDSLEEILLVNRDVLQRTESTKQQPSQGSTQKRSS